MVHFEKIRCLEGSIYFFLCREGSYDFYVRTVVVISCVSVLYSKFLVAVILARIYVVSIWDSEFHYDWMLIIWRIILGWYVFVYLLWGFADCWRQLVMVWTLCGGELDIMVGRLSTYSILWFQYNGSEGYLDQVFKTFR